MFRIDTANAADVLPTPAAPGPNPNGYFSHGDVSDLNDITFPTMVDADFCNALQETLCYVIEEAGITLSKSNRGQLKQAIQYYIDEGGTGGIGLADVEADPAPTLGNNLIVNDKKIISSGPIIFNVNEIDIQTANFAVKNKISKFSNGASYYFNFGTDTQEFFTLSNKVVDINNSGLTINNSTYITTIYDQDNMSSGSGTATFTQQSGKKYADDTIAVGQRSFSALVYSLDGSDPQLNNSNPFTFMLDFCPIVVPKDATLSNLRVIWAGSWNTGTWDPVVFTVRKNGVNTALTVTIGLVNGAQDVTDSTHSVSFAAGDLLDIRATTTETSTIALPYLDVSFKGF